MRLRRSVSLLLSQALLAGSLIGCREKPKPAPPAPPPPASAEQVAEYQQQFAQYDKNARVGSVASVSTKDAMAAITGIPLTDIKVGEVVTITDSAQTPLANGTVETMTTTGGEFVIVDYQSLPGARAPQVGDVAIHFMPKK